VQQLIRTLDESVLVSDQLDRTASFLRALGENPTVSDQLDRTQLLVRTISEPSISVADSISVHTIFARVISEIVNVVDRVVGSLPVGHIHFHTIIKRAGAFGTRIKKSMSFTTRLE
jgi:hypothetical protein